MHFLMPAYFFQTAELITVRGAAEVTAVLTAFVPLTKLLKAVVAIAADVDAAVKESTDVVVAAAGVVTAGVNRDVVDVVIIRVGTAEILVVTPVVPKVIKLFILLPELLLFINVVFMVAASINEAGDIEGLAPDDDGDEQSL